MPFFLYNTLRYYLSFFQLGTLCPFFLSLHHHFSHNLPSYHTNYHHNKITPQIASFISIHQLTVLCLRSESIQNTVSKLSYYTSNLLLYLAYHFTSVTSNLHFYPPPNIFIPLLLQLYP